MLGTRVVLSSATLPPALVEGMFMAYRAGRRHYQHNRGRDGGSNQPAEVPCLWTDEFGVQAGTVANDGGFAAAHARFVKRRVGKLRAAEPLRLAELVPIDIAAKQPELVHVEFASQVRDACLRLHHDHAHSDPVTGKRVSFGLVRMANIDPIFDVASALYTHAAPEGTRIHLCVYHARFPLAQRSAIENMLDATFNRRNEDAVWQLAQIRHALDTHPEHEQLFVVLASPVCEVGRDWDADWAVAEPSSMRSLIQLAGRVQRHRRKAPQTPNVLVFDTNLKGIKQRDSRQPVFARPGFETERDNGRFLLASHSLRMLLAEDEYRHLDAQPRIQPRATELQPRERWVDLEQARMRAAMLPPPPVAATRSTRRSTAPIPRLERDYASATWQHPRAALAGVLPQQQPFRHDEQPGTTLAWLPNEDEDDLLPHRVEDAPGSRRGEKLYVPARELLNEVALNVAPGISCWGEFDLPSLVNEQAEAQDLPLDLAARRFTTVEVPSLKENHQGWRWHPWLGFTKQR
jgi:CRISPR-associated endonuclease/helicase Cas3